MSIQNFSVILLNLDRDTERLEHMEKQLSKAYISFTRQSGVVGDTLPNHLRPYFYDAADRPKTIMKRGEIGCYASHLRALQRVASGEFGDNVLILEDDLDIAPDLTDIISDAVQAAPEGWDILRLSCPPRRAYVPVAWIGAGRSLVRYSKIPNSAGAYLVTAVGAKKFLRHGVRGLTFDDDLRRPWFHDMETYGIVPPPVKAGVLRSTIDTIEPGRFNKGVSSRMERLLRGDHLYALKRVTYNMRFLGMRDWLLCGGINVTDMCSKALFDISILHRATRVFMRNDED